MSKAGGGGPSVERALAILACLGGLASGACGGVASGSGPGTGGRGGAGGGLPGTGGTTSNGSGGSPGSGGTSAGSGGTAVGSGGASAGSGGTSGAGGAAGGAGFCTASIMPAPNYSLTGNEVGTTFRVQGTLNPPNAAVVWTWHVMPIPSGSEIATTPVNGMTSLVEFTFAAAGMYQIYADITQPPGSPFCRQPPTIVATAVPRGPPSYVFRASPPGLPVQDTRVQLSDADGATHPLVLAAGTSVAIVPEAQAQQNSVALAYVRISDPRSGITIEGDTAHGPLLANLLPEIAYEVLVIPAAPIAPILLTGTPPNPVVIDDGVPVSVSVSTSDGTPVDNVRMVLNRGAVPSTVGVSDANGGMSLLARAGTLSALIVPPLDSGLLTVSVGADGGAGIVLGSGVPALNLSLQWAARPRGALMLNVLSQDGVSSVAGARVRLATSAPVANAGTLTVTATAAGGADIVLPATGSIETEVLSDASGNAFFASLPTSPYDVTVIPPAAASPTAAITTVTIALTAGGLSRGVTLVDKVNLAGTLLPLPGAAGAQVTASDVGPSPTGAWVSTTTDGNGFFSLPVDPERSYQLTVQPAAGAAFGRTVLGTFAVGAGDTSAGTTTLPNGLLFKGTVQTTNQIVIAGTLIQVFCVPSDPSCVDPTFAVASATSGGDGGFAFYLPDLPAAPASP